MPSRLQEARDATFAATKAADEAAKLFYRDFETTLNAMGANIMPPWDLVAKSFYAMRAARNERDKLWAIQSSILEINTHAQTPTR